MNEIILIGNLGRDPLHKTTNGGMSVLEFSMATKERYKDKDITEWHNIVLFGKQADWLSGSLKKGAQVFVKGSKRTEKFTNKEGREVEKCTIVAQIVKPFVGAIKQSEELTEEEPF